MKAHTGDRAEGAYERDRLFDLSLDLLCVQGADGYFKLLNPAWESTLGYSLQELTARPSIEFVHPLDREATALENRKLVEGQDTIEFENRYRCRDGSYRLLSWSATADKASGLFFAVARYVTDRRVAEEAARESEAGFLLLTQVLERQAGTLREQAQLLDLASDVVLVRDMEDRIVFWNRGAELTYGWTREEVLGQQAHRLLRTQARGSFEEARTELVREGRWEGELVHTRRDGTEVVVYSRWVLDRDPEGEPRVVLEINRDTTERRAAEEAFRESEARFRAVFEAAAIGIGLADMEGRYVESNAALQEMVGYTGDELRGASFGDFTHPADTSRDVELYEELVAGRRDHYQVETRITRKDGRVGWVRITRSLIRGSDGRPQYSIAMAEDLRLALVDDLTGLNNRRAFLMLAQHHLALSRRNGSELMLLFIDVDDMKEINDSLGHAQGDRALIDAATVLIRTFRESDVVARVGGDEFCVLLTNVDGTPNELTAISRLRETVNRYRAEASRPYALSLSVGASRFDPEGPQTLGELIDLADRSMYEEKARRPVERP